MSSSTASVPRWALLAVLVVLPLSALAACSDDPEPGATPSPGYSTIAPPPSGTFPPEETPPPVTAEPSEPPETETAEPSDPPETSRTTTPPPPEGAPDTGGGSTSGGGSGPLMIAGLGLLAAAAIAARHAARQ